MDPTIQSTFMDAAAGTGVLWRDMMTAMLYGTLFAIDLEGGTTLHPIQFVEKISRALDLIGAETGAMLIRGQGQWITVRPGEVGQVLTSTGPDSLPTWA